MQLVTGFWGGNLDFRALVGPRTPRLSSRESTALPGVTPPARHSGSGSASPPSALAGSNSGPAFRDARAYTKPPSTAMLSPVT